MCLCQLIEVLSSSDPSPFMENVFCNIIKKKWNLTTKKGGLRNACTFSNIFRVIDDCENIYIDLYRDDPELQK